MIMNSCEERNKSSQLRYAIHILLTKIEIVMNACHSRMRRPLYRIESTIGRNDKCMHVTIQDCVHV